jgi:hypothetical protein
LASSPDFLKFGDVDHHSGNHTGGMGENQSLPDLAYSPAWLRYFRFGPVEWLWRSTTYWKIQPLRR